MSLVGLYVRAQLPPRRDLRCREAYEEGRGLQPGLFVWARYESTAPKQLQADSRSSRATDCGSTLSRLRRDARNSRRVGFRRGGLSATRLTIGEAFALRALDRDYRAIRVREATRDAV